MEELGASYADGQWHVKVAHGGFALTMLMSNFVFIVRAFVPPNLFHSESLVLSKEGVIDYAEKMFDFIDPRERLGVLQYATYVQSVIEMLQRNRPLFDRAAFERTVAVCKNLGIAEEHWTFRFLVPTLDALPDRARLPVRWTNGTITGRLLSKELNLNGLAKSPVSKNYGGRAPQCPSPREWMRPPYGRIVELDIAGADATMMAIMSGDPAMLQCMAEGDLYTSLAKDVGVERSAAKTLFLATMYGMRDETAVSRGFTEAACVGVRAAAERRFPRLMEWAKAVQETSHRGVVRTFLGLTMYGLPRQRAVSHLVQAATADLVLLTAARARTALLSLGMRIGLIRYDEFIVWAPEGADPLPTLLDCLRHFARAVLPAGLKQYASVVRLTSSDKKG